MIRLPAGFGGEVRVKRYLDYFQPSYGAALLGADGVGNSALTLLGNEPNGMAIDFLTNTYVVRFSTSVETLLWDEASGLAMDFTNNTYAVRTI
jgi:hypothetical protein